MTPQLHRHTETDPKPEMLSAVLAENRIRRDIKNEDDLKNEDILKSEDNTKNTASTTLPEKIVDDSSA